MLAAFAMHQCPPGLRGAGGHGERMADKNVNMTKKPNVDKFEQYLRGCDFPCNRQDVERVARKNNAPPEILNQIRDLPERRYAGISEVQTRLQPSPTTPGTK